VVDEPQEDVDIERILKGNRIKIGPEGD